RELSSDEIEDAKSIASLIQKELLLDHSFGVIRLWHDPISSKFYPMDVFFGFPLYDSKINQKVCETIKSNLLFSCENLDHHSRNMRHLSLHLLDFISKQQDFPLELESGTFQHPSKELTFNVNDILE